MTKKRSRAERRREEKSARKNPKKERSGFPRWTGGILVILLMGFGLVEILKSSESNVSTDVRDTSDQIDAPQTKTVLEVTRPLVDQYFVKHNQQDNYWLSHNDSRKFEVAKMKAWPKRSEELMEKYRNTCSETELICQHFNTLIPSRFQRGISMMMLDSIEDATKPPPENSIEVCMIPRVEENFPGLPRASLFYRAEWGALMINSIVIPDPWLVATLYHELWHAYKHRIEKAPSATANPQSDIFIVEEVEAHEIETDVLHAASQQMLCPLLDNIVNRVGRPSVESMLDVFESITMSDLDTYDIITGANGVGDNMASITIAQLIIAVGFRIIDLDDSLSEKDRLDHKIKFYREVCMR